MKFGESVLSFGLLGILMTTATMPVAVHANAATPDSMQIPQSVENKETVRGNFGSATAECVVTGDLLDVDITLNSVRGKIAIMAGTVTTDAGHIKAFSHIPVRSKYEVNDSVQLSLEEVEAGTYTATVLGSGTTTEGIFAFTTSCDFSVQ